MNEETKENTNRANTNENTHTDINYKERWNIKSAIYVGRHVHM
jgi:hypothetical protein